MKKFHILGSVAFLPLLFPLIPLSGFATFRQTLASNFQWGCTSTSEPITSYVNLISSDPLLLYLDGFLSSHEITYLLELGQPLFQRSMITGGKISPARTSDSCFLPGNDSVVIDGKHRAAQFLGGVTFDGLEAIQLVRYSARQKVNLHYDWHQNQLPVDTHGRNYNRLASFFIYLDANCTGGATLFPNVTVSASFGTNNSSYIHLLDSGKGIAVIPKAGNGLFWINMVNGRGDRRTQHAGLLVASGTKVGVET